MKLTIVVILFALSACGPESSPEGRMQMKIHGIQKQIDSLKIQGNELRDSIGIINQEIQKLKSRG